MARLGRVLFVVIAVGFGTAALVNVYADDADVRREAEGVACPRGCPKTTSIAYERTPFAETVSYTATDGTIRVRCARAAILVGPYSCSRE